MQGLKNKTFKTILRPVISYGSETWTLTIGEENMVQRCEIKILIKMYGLTMENGV